MNKQLILLYDAISGIDPKYIEESVNPPRRTRKPVLHVAAVAAILALFLTLPSLFPNNGKLVTIPGMLTVTAYSYQGGSNFKEIPMENKIVSSLFNDGYCPIIINCVPGHPITFQIPDGENITIDISVNEGHLYDWSKDIVDGKFIKRNETGIRSQNVTLTKTMTLYWINTYEDPDTGEIAVFYPERYIENKESIRADGAKELMIHNGTRMNNIYVDIIVKTEGNITGYAVLQLNPVYNGGFQLVLRKAQSYPKVNGEYQNISEEYIRSKIQAAK